MNKLYVGFNKEIELPEGGYLLLDDEVKGDRWSKFDPRKHSFNALANMDYKKARDFATLIYAMAPQGENTLTVRNGKRALVKLLLRAPKLSELPSSEIPGEEEAV